MIGFRHLKVSDELSNQLRSFYEKNNYIQGELYYWSNIDGEVNLTNFEGWLNLGTARRAGELADKVFSVIEEVSNRLRVNIKDLSKGLSEEVARATEVEAELAKGLAEEIERAIKAEEGIDSKIADIISNTDLSSIDSFSEVVDSLNAEVADRIADVDAEEARAKDAESKLEGELFAESDARIAGDEALAADLAKGLADGITSDEALKSDLSSEIERAQSVESSITKRVDAEYYKSWLLTKLQMEKS